MSADFNLLKVFLAVAQAGNFSAAAEQLGVTRSAVSQSMRRLEDDLGIALVQRSTRSVSLTEAGVRLRTQITEPFTAIASALEEVVDDGPPRGLLRVAVTSIAERFLSGPLVASFAEAYPSITLDITVTDEEFDIIGAGFDAGVRLGEVIEQDMVAVPLSGPQRQVVVASPRYLQRRGTPVEPFELLDHLCIGWRPAPSVVPYRWEFTEQGREFDVGVNPQITTNDMLLMIRTALAGGGITIGMEETFLPWLESGELVSLLQKYLQPFPGFYLYFPNRRNQPPKLRALIAHVRAYREAMEPL